MDVALEIGSKKVFASALDWPGWCRSGKTDDAALEALAAYADRYAPVVKAAGLRLPMRLRLDVVERLPGSGATDFGVPDKPATADHRPLTKAQAATLADILEASWATFDRVVAGAPAELRKGPRGGGRDRDAIAAHVAEAEGSYARMIGLPAKATRADIVAAVRAARDPMPDRPKGWPYRYAARRIAWHVLDHAWEIEDRST